MQNTKKILFIDIDGVLNDHSRHDNGYCGFKPECVKELNYILDSDPEIQLVISSSWRYMIHPDAMTLLGFEYVLIIAGVNCRNRVVGYTVRDEVTKMRDDQIKEWATRNGLSHFVVLDDLPLEMKELVRTNGEVGLTRKDAEEVLARFNQ